ncbi:MAG TPA: hypothetical protein QF802_03270 [Candidatus Thalassarchaeaceae archaeon]|nr:hypothetical protein [Candidatus Thalassarchaeaceae archaeon]
MAINMLSALILWIPALIPWLMYYLDRKEKLSHLGSVAGFYGTIVIVFSCSIEQRIRNYIDWGWSSDELLLFGIAGIIASAPIILLAKKSNHRDVRILSLVILGFTVLLAFCIPIQMFLAEVDQEAIQLQTFAAATIFVILIGIIPIPKMKEEMKGVNDDD